MQTDNYALSMQASSVLCLCLQYGLGNDSLEIAGQLLRIDRTIIVPATAEKVLTLLLAYLLICFELLCLPRMN